MNERGIPVRHLVLTVGAIVLFVFLLTRDPLAHVAWERYQSAAWAYRLNGGDAAFARSLGDYHFGGGVYDLSKARAFYEQALSIEEGLLWGHYQLARINFVEGKSGAALAHIRQELEHNPDNLRALYVRGLIYGYRDFPGDLEKAEADFARFVLWAPSEWAGYNDLAWIQIRRERFAEARDTISRAFERLPWTREKTPWLYATLGSAYLNLDENKAAVEAFLRARALAASMTPEYFWSAYPGNDPRNAEDAFAQFRATLHFNLGVVYEKMGKWEQAKDSYESYLVSVPEGPFPKQHEVEEKINTLITRVQ